jgi:glycosyltransferase involved in cell wall biosynthesis
LFRYSSVLLPKPLRQLFFWLVAKFPRASRRYIYLTDSYRLRDEYLSNAGLELAVLPVPVEIPGALFTRPALPEPNQRLRISYLGAARNDKGFSELPGIIETVLNSEFASQVEFCVQASASGTGYLESECLQAMGKLRRIQSSQATSVVRLLDKPLDESEYKELLTNSNLILLPYTGQSYTAQTSGILIEAAAYQVPCIVPKGTWLEDELEITGGGAIFDPDDPGSAGRAVLQVLRSYASYADKARAGGQIIAERHGQDAFARSLNENLLLFTN